MNKNCPVPGFLSKLWTLVEDQSTNDLIRWSQDGCSFLVLDDLRFSKEVLPLYFKHSNMTSFVRQLNMYDFHKVANIECGLPTEGTHTQRVGFQHSCFQRSRAHLLNFIRRKVSVSRVTEDAGQMSQVSVELSRVQKWHDSSHLNLLTLCRDNESLWREVDSLQQQYQHQLQIIRKIVHFIASTLQTNTLKGVKRKLPMIDSSRESSPAPKFRRSASVESSRTHPYMDSRVYYSKVILSEISRLLQPDSKLNSLSVSVEIPSASSSVSSLSTEMHPVLSDVPSGSTDVPSRSNEKPPVFTELPSVSPSIPRSEPSDILSMFTEVPSLSKDLSSMFSQVPSVVTSVTSSLCPEVPSMFSDVLSESTSVPSLGTELPLMFGEIPSVATSVPSSCHSAQIRSVFSDVPSGSTSDSSEPAARTVEHALSLLMEPETREPIENSAERCEDDPLALIDSSLAAISCSLAPSDGLDLLSEFFSTAVDASDHDAMSTQTAERKPGAQSREDPPLYTHTASVPLSPPSPPLLFVPAGPEAAPLAALGLCGGGGDDDDDEDDGEGSDILPSLLQLAQEVSVLSMPTSVPLPPPSLTHTHTHTPEHAYLCAPAPDTLHAPSCLLANTSLTHTHKG